MTINDIPSAPLAQPCPAYRPPAVFEVSSTDSIGTKSASSFPFNGNGSASSSTACVSAIGSDTTDSSATLTTLSHGQQKWQPQSFSTSRLVAAHIGAALTLFLATTDTTIVSTSLPTIAATLHGTQADYTWVGVAYMLTQTACQPLYGRLSDLLGRKCVLFTSILIFAIGSLLCGAAQNITWLILARGLSGVGGGGIVSCVWVITSEIVETEKRAKWSQALSVTWSCSAVAGPLLGGIFSGETSQPSILTWRWAFYLNLPICFVATIVLGLSLRGSEVDHLKNVSWHTFIMKFDFLGLMLFISGSSAIIVGFSFAASFGWLAPSTLALVITGIIVLVLGGVYEAKTTREALFPPTAFKNINVVIILLINFLHNFAFTSGTFYLARFYQLSGSRTILESSLMVLPYSLGSSLASMPAAWFMDYYQAKSGNLNGQRMVIVSGLIVATTGFGLLELLRQGTSPLFQAMIPLIAGIGLGMLFHAPYQVFSRALPPKLLATGTSAFFLVRFTGATIGLALSGAMYSAFTDVEVDSARERLSHGELRSASQAIRYVWVLCTPLLGVALLVSIFLRPVDTTKTKIGDTESTIDTTFHEKGAVTAIPAN